MNFNNIIKYFTVLVLIIVLVSCKKAKENKLIGTWENQPMKNTMVVTDDEQLWTFDAASKLKIVDKQTDTTYYYEGIYSVSSKNMGISGYYIQITNVDGSLDGRYKIEKIDDTKLSLFRVELADGNTAGAFLWLDFLKNE